ncbi:sulfonate transport system substrate-binding protein [Cohnella sp. SGD-V74]|uniref:ABC transporter substrate-binding protein n=1 Tax=unclassified Cohnella TaxID=2636738 RepID=UPI000D4CC974|nr:sulfonate transport system substrate-binding protein [Cohnella sp. SGD-V74]
MEMWERDESKTRKEMGKRGWTGALLAGVIALALVIQGCGAKEEKQASAPSAGGASASSGEPARNVPEVLNYGYIGLNDKNHAPGAEGWGLYKGIIQEELKKYGIKEVKLTGFPNGPDQTESLISGRLDIGSLGDTPAIIARAGGAKTRLIAQPNTRTIGHVIAGPNGPKTIQELQGKTLAIQKGSFMHRYVVGLLKEAGVTDYKLVHMLIPDAQAALANGSVDAMTDVGLTALKSIESGNVQLDVSSDHPELLGTSSTVVSEDYLKKFPDFPKVWNEAREKALADLQQNPEEYYQFLADFQKTTVDIVKKLSPIEDIKDTAFTDDGLKLLEGTKNFLVEEKLAKNDFAIEDWVLKAE